MPPCGRHCHPHITAEESQIQGVVSDFGPYPSAGRWVFDPGLPPSKAHAFPTALSFCSSVVTLSSSRFGVAHSSEVFVCVYFCHTKSGFTLQPGAYFCDSVFIFSQGPGEPRSHQHSWEAQGFHLSCLLILRTPAKCSLLWRCCICRQKTRMPYGMLHPLHFPCFWV